MTTQIKAGVIAANAVNSSELASGALSGQNFTGDVTFDTTTLFVDSTNNRVGIGTASPTTGKLVIDADNNAVGLRLNGGTTTGQSFGSRIRAGTNSSDYGLLVEDTSANTILVARGNGNVGIGTSSPDSMLHLSAGSTGVSGGGSAAITMTNKFDNPDNSWIIAPVRSGVSNTGLEIRDVTDSRTDMVFDGSGNVGIGMNNPSAKLEVQDANGVSLKFGDLASYPNNVVPCFIGTATSALAGVNGDLVLVPRTSDAGKIIFATGNGGAATEKVRIANDGNVGIGQTNPGVKLEIGENSSSTNVGYIRLRGHNTLEGNIYKDATYGLHFDTNSNNQPIRIDGSKQILGITGNVGIGTESPSSSAKTHIKNSNASFGFLVENSNASYGAVVIAHTATSGTRYLVDFRAGSINPGDQVGTITTNGSTTAYNTSSDYRLKENVAEMTGALDRVNQLQPKRFNFIADADTIVDGFLAHEVSDIVPEAITGEKDGVDDEGNPEYQGIDQSKLVPLLTKAIQEQQTIIDDLKSRIETLEG